MATVADFIDRAVAVRTNPSGLAKIKEEVAAFCAKFPMPH